MPSTKKPITPTQKEQRRVQRYIREAEKQGYTVDPSIKEYAYRKTGLRGVYAKLKGVVKPKFQAFFAFRAPMPSEPQYESGEAVSAYHDVLNPSKARQASRRREKLIRQQTREQKKHIKELRNRLHREYLNATDEYLRFTLETIRDYPAKDEGELKNQQWIISDIEKILKKRAKQKEEMPSIEPPLDTVELPDESLPDIDFDEAPPLDGFGEEDEYPDQTDIAFQNLLDELDRIPSKGADIVKRELDRLVNKYGSHAVANVLDEEPNLYEEIEYVMHYSDGESRDFSASIKNFTRGLEFKLSGKDTEAETNYYEIY